MGPEASPPLQEIHPVAQQLSEYYILKDRIAIAKTFSFVINRDMDTIPVTLRCRGPLRLAAVNSFLVSECATGGGKHKWTNLHKENLLDNDSCRNRSCRQSVKIGKVTIHDNPDVYGFDGFAAELIP